MLCAKIGWNWLNDSGEDFKKKIVKVFSLFRYYLPLEKGEVLHLNINEFPSPKDDLSKLVKISPVILAKKIL